MTDIEYLDPEEPEVFEFFARADLDTSDGKGMKALPGHAMINFLRWLRKQHPEVKSIRALSVPQLIQLVEEFAGGRVAWDVWAESFRLLLKGQADTENYEAARLVLKELGL